MKNVIFALLLAMAPASYGSAAAAQDTGSSVKFPAGYAPGSAPCVMQVNNACIPVSASAPLPITNTATQSAATSTPLAGSASGTSTVGPFTPQLGRAINLTLSGTWAGTAQLLRSIDAGVTKTPITVGGTTWASYSSNVNEPVWTETEVGGTYYLALNVSGTINYRVAQ